MNITVRVLDSLDEFRNLREAWTDLQSRSSACNNPFLSWEWQYTWWEFYGKRSRLLLILLYQGDRLVGIAPLVFSRHYVFIKEVKFIGAGLSDALGFILEKDYEEDLEKEILKYLDRMKWALLDLNQLQCQLAIDENGFEGQKVYESVPCTNLFINLPQTFDQYTALLSKGYLKELLYYERRLHREFDVELVQAKTTQDTNFMLDEFFSLHEKRWQREPIPGAFRNKRARDFLRTACLRFLDIDALRLIGLKLNGEYAAIMLNFGYGNKWSYYNGGFDPLYARFNVASVLMRNAVKQAIEEDYEEFDFLRGDEPYKLKWGALSRNYNRLRVYKHQVMWYLVLISRALASDDFGRIVRSVQYQILQKLRR